MVLPPRFEHAPWDEVVAYPARLLGREPALGDQHVDVRIELQVRTECVLDHDDPRYVPRFLSTPLEHRRLCRMEEYAEQRTMPRKDIAELPWYGKDEVVVGHVEELGLRPLHPAVGLHLPTRRAEPRLTGVGDDALGDAPWRGTPVAVVAHTLRITTGEHLRYRLDDCRTE